MAGVIDRALVGLDETLAEEADFSWAGGFRYASFLEDQRHWAFPPAKVNYSFSLDGENFAAQHSINSKYDLYEQYEKSVIDYEYNLTMPIKTRYVKVKAQNLKQLPQWRYYKNKKAWLFADEIMIK